jgi:pyruvate dehydrogenase E1 component
VTWRWKRAAGVHHALERAGDGGARQPDLGDLGGHIASYASAADLFEVGFNHFFRARNAQRRGDLVFFQPHSAPGVYARAFLEGRLDEADLLHYRQEITAPSRGARGLSSYPHPWLMPDFWQFPTGSMGIGPISSIFHARFMRYLTHRQLLDAPPAMQPERTDERRVWGVFGDGEMDEPESMSALTLASREGLDNLVWVVNCNLQRLDGPVRGNGRIVDELERLFAGAGWNVIKLLWGSDWDGLFARDTQGAVARLCAHRRRPDADLRRQGRPLQPRHLLRPDAGTGALAQGMTDEQIDRLKRGGHDLVKIHAAYAAAAGAPRAADRDPGAHQEGLRHGQRRPGPHDHAPAEEAGRGRPDRVPQPLQPAAQRRAGHHAGLPQAGRRTATSTATCTHAGRRWAATMPQRSSACDVLPVPPVDSYAFSR